MAFVPITDLEEADKLWEVGLLWYRFGNSERFFFDDTYKWTAERETQRPTTANYIDYFILVED